MRTHLAVGFALAGALSMGAFSGCGAEVDPPSIDDPTATADDPLLLEGRSFVTIRRDLRKCMAPLCGGYFVKRVNVADRERYVDRLELADERIPGGERMLADVREAPTDAVLLGRVGEPGLRYGTRPFVFTTAWRGMPGVDPSPGDTYYRVDHTPGPGLCLGEPCAAFTVRTLNLSAGQRATRVAIDDAALPHVQRSWVLDRVLHHGALIAARFDRAHTTLDASQVFVRLPALPALCPAKHPACFAGFAPAFTRDPERCLDFDRCIEVDGCRLSPRPLFECPRGYTYTHWTADADDCVRAACDPAFAAE